MTLLQNPFSLFLSNPPGAKGYNDNTPNQDNFSYTIYGSWHLIVVMDGHGPSGHRVSTRCVQTIPYYLIKSDFWGQAQQQMSSKATQAQAAENYKQALTEAFALASKDLLGFAIEADFDVSSWGCFAGGLSGSYRVLIKYKTITLISRGGPLQAHAESEKNFFPLQYSLQLQTPY